MDVLLAKHAQHVVLIHFPIALFVLGVAFDLASRGPRRHVLADVAYYNLAAAAWSTIPTLVTGLLAWKLQLGGRRLHGVLLRHLVLGCASSLTIALTWWVHSRARRRAEPLPRHRWALELLGIGLVALTGHLGGVLSGVNVPI